MAKTLCGAYHKSTQMLVIKTSHLFLRKAVNVIVVANV
ncbi:Uncharacterised protein [Vibrio cholerae]|nr:Uncharacterised protein [Vibrio cholerae]